MTATWMHTLRYSLIAIVHVALAVAMFAVVCTEGDGNSKRVLADGSQRYDYNPMIVNTWIGTFDGKSCESCVASEVSDKFATLGPNDGPICAKAGDPFCVGRPAMWAESRANGHLFGQFHPLVFVLTFQWLTASYAVFYLYFESWPVVWPYIAILWNALGMVLWAALASNWGLPSGNLFMLEVIFACTIIVQVTATTTPNISANNVQDKLTGARLAKECYMNMLANKCCYLRFAEYSTTAGLLAMGLMAFLSVQDEKAYQFALFLILFTNLWGVAIELLSGAICQLPQKPPNAQASPFFQARARLFSAMWLFMASSWAVYTGFLVSYINEIVPVLDAFSRDRGPPAFVVVAMISVIALYSVFGFITTGAQMAKRINRTGSWYATYIFLLDLCSLVVKSLVGLAIFTSLGFLVSGTD